MKRHNSFCDVFKDERRVSMVFLGIGLSLFFLNISTLLFLLPVNYSYFNFDVSVFASIIIVIYSTYILYNKK